MMLQGAQQSAAASASVTDGALGPLTDRDRARLQAHLLVQQVQVRDTGTELADQLAAAESAGWPEVARVLLYANVVRSWAQNGGDREATIRRLHDRAVSDHDDVLLASALASSAEIRFRSPTAALREQANRDLARAAALLEVGAGGALERATAYIDCGLGYGQRELWELEEQMYARAAEVLGDSNERLLDPALAYNQAFVHAHRACSLREMDDEEGLRALWRRVSADGPVARGPETVASSPSFAVDVRIAQHLVCRLVRTAPTEESADLADALAADPGLYTETTHGMLRLADAVGAADRGDWDAVSRHSAAALELFVDDVAGPVMAMTLRLATQALVAQGATGAEAAMAYSAWSAQRRWDARLQLLAAAHALLEAEQLRVERDEHARQAQADELTGLANRRGYTRHVERLRLLDCTEPLAVLVVDIDNFKGVNDTFGHDIGDEVLKQVAQVLARATRHEDLAARLGGDEFVVMLDGLDRAAAERRARHMLAALTDVDWTGMAPTLAVSISIGVAVGPCWDPQDLLLRADRALYRTKSQGGDGVTLSDD